MEASKAGREDDEILPPSLRMVRYLFVVGDGYINVMLLIISSYLSSLDPDRHYKI